MVDKDWSYGPISLQLIALIPYLFIIFHENHNLHSDIPPMLISLSIQAYRIVDYCCKYYKLNEVERFPNTFFQMFF